MERRNRDAVPVIEAPDPGSLGSRFTGSTVGAESQNEASQMELATGTGSGKYERLLTQCRTLPPVPTAVVYPCEAHALTGAVDAWNKKLIVPILVGPASKMAATAKLAGVDLVGLEIVDVPDSPSAAGKAVGVVRPGRAGEFM